MLSLHFDTEVSVRGQNTGLFFSPSFKNLNVGEEIKT